LLNDLKKGLSDGHAFKINHKIDRQYLRSVKETLNSCLKFVNDAYALRVRGVLRPGYETSLGASYAAIFSPVAASVASPRCSCLI
jgi:hypothetical protein